MGNQDNPGTSAWQRSLKRIHDGEQRDREQRGLVRKTPIEVEVNWLNDLPDKNRFIDPKEYD